MLRAKRKCMDCDEDESISSENVSFLEGEMKKIKIAPTPGELRLQKDLIAAYQQFPMLQILQGENPSTLVIAVPLVVEIRFTITVQKYYPHCKPSIKCLDPHKVTSPFIDRTGEVSNTLLDEWNALRSLSDVIRMLEIICSSLVVRV